MSDSFELPPVLYKENGEERRVGLEIEMSGIELSMIACQINIAFGGRIEEISPFEFKIKDTELGDFKIELDFVYLKNYARQKYEELQSKKFNPEPDSTIKKLDQFFDDIAELEIGDLEGLASEALTLVAKNVVPFELITPPLSLKRLYIADTLIKRLREHGAKGTRHLIVYAFGVHLNPELPNTRVDTILKWFKAFLCLHDWLIEQEKTVLSRRLSPFIKRFPSDYIRKVIAVDYQPSIAQFIDDYLDANPTRNRALDLLPLLAWLDEKRVRKVLPEEKISRRPTFHYRLPNSDIDNPHWSISQCWNNWVLVERLANDPRRLSEMTEALGHHLELFTIESIPWKNRVKSCIEDLS